MTLDFFVNIFLNFRPDKSVPLEAQSILELINRIDSQQQSKSSPVLIHCSAGIGRTGTLIAIINLIEMMKQNKVITPKKVLYDIRKQRAFLVQNWVKLNSTKYNSLSR